MATYEEIRAYVKSKYGFYARDCWIAHVKEICGIPIPKAWNRTDGRKNPCPPNKIKFIKNAFRHFEMI